MMIYFGKILLLIAISNSTNAITVTPSLENIMPDSSYHSCNPLSSRESNLNHKTIEYRNKYINAVMGQKNKEQLPLARHNPAFDDNLISSNAPKAGSIGVFALLLSSMFGLYKSLIRRKQVATPEQKEHADKLLQFLNNKQYRCSHKAFSDAIGVYHSNVLEQLLGELRPDTSLVVYDKNIDKEHICNMPQHIDSELYIHDYIIRDGDELNKLAKEYSHRQGKK